MAAKYGMMTEAVRFYALTMLRDQGGGTHGANFFSFLLTQGETTASKFIEVICDGEKISAV